jgi:hypothetical protein
VTKKCYTKISYNISTFTFGSNKLPKRNNDRQLQLPNDRPEWLQTKIDSIATIKYYALTKVYSYKWKEKLIYYFSIPFSSCVYCELYNEVGNRFILSGDSVAQDFMQNKKDKTLIWERKN